MIRHGNRIHELLGEPNSETTRNRLRLFILETLQQEPRIEKIESLSVVPNALRRDRVDVELRVVPRGGVDTVTIGPFTLRLEQ